MFDNISYLIYTIGPWIISIPLARMSCLSWFGSSLRGFSISKKRSLLLLVGIYLWVLIPHFKEGLSSTLTFAAILSVLVGLSWLLTVPKTDCFNKDVEKIIRTILSILSKNEKASGIDIINQSNSVVKDYHITIYLEEMQKAGLVTSELDSNGVKKKDGKIYSITEKGRERFNQLNVNYDKVLAKNALA